MISVTTDIEKVSDEEIISIFEYRYDMGGDIDTILLDKYLKAIDNKTDRKWYYVLFKWENKKHFRYRRRKTWNINNYF